MEKDKKHLYYLNELSDYKVKSDDPDVRGWQIQDREGRSIGKVDNLLVNKESEKVVYLDVELDKSILEAKHTPYSNPAREGAHEVMNKDGENHLIVPIGLVSLDSDKKIVHSDTIDHRTFSETKRMEKGSSVDRKYEIMVLDSYNREQSPSYAEGERLYEREEYNPSSSRNT
ncbi:photosystem reaction center subunit H [Gramella sp. BOM4]|nr:photosystem reaction center subunit H [Christiangramia bathymodioli]